MKSGDILRIIVPDENSKNIVPSNIPLDIIYEDDDILVLNKQAGIPTHPSHNHFENTLANGVMNYYKDRPFTFRAITRLDRDTSGIVLIAKNRYSANILSNQVKERRVKKEYYAICEGKFDKMSDTISAPIARTDKSVIKRTVCADGAFCETFYRVVSFQQGYSLVLLKPLTGRTHQIRVHMSYIGHPLYADYIYGKEIENERTRLHCSKITFIHPITSEEVSFECDTPDDFFIK